MRVHQTCERQRAHRRGWSFVCAVVAVLGLMVTAGVLGAVPASAATVSTGQAQWDLARLGYLPFAGIDGRVSRQTQNATRAFQSDACLSVDDVLGSNTTSALMAKVRRVQAVVGTAQDGAFGPGTEQAVKNWQRARGLSADGQAGARTMTAMNIRRSACAPPSAGPPPVARGDSSTARAQWDLAGLGYLIFNGVDGVAGPQTAAAAEAFQKDACIGVDGIIGPITTSALVATVKRVQAVVGATQDGGFGPLTERAVKNWQQAHGVGPVDGQAGAETMRAMGITRTAACTSPPPPPPAGNLGGAITSVATAELNNPAHNHEAAGYNCNYYSTVLGVGETSCSTGWRTGEWCADFATWVWRQAGANVGGLTAAAASFASYGKSHNTWHTTGPRVGDAVVFDLSSDGSTASHVGLVTGVSGSSFTMISGNAADPVDGQVDAVAQVSLADSRGGVAGFASPVSATPTPPPGSTGHSTNVDWARVVLQDGGWPTSANNIAVLTQWMDSEESPAHWWNRNNPLNNGLGSGGGAGLGSYPDLLTAAHYVAENLHGGSSYASVVRDLASSAPPTTTAAAIWDSPWASSHYGYGGSWHSGTVPTVAAPASAW